MDQGIKMEFEPKAIKLSTSEEIIACVEEAGGGEVILHYPVRAVMVGNGNVQFIPFIATSDSASFEMNKRFIVTMGNVDEHTLPSYESVVEQMQSPNVIIPDTKLVL